MRPVVTSARRRSRLPIVLGAVLALLVIGGGIAAAMLTSRGSGSNPPLAAAPTVTATAAPAPTTTPAPVTTSTAPTTTPTTAPRTTTAAPTTTARTTTPTTDPGTVADPAAFVQNYYALLPGNTSAAYALLSPAAQTASGGQSNFNSFYGSMSSVTAENTRRTGANTASATIRFVTRAGVTTNEAYSFVMGTGADGRTIMQSFSKG